MADESRYPEMDKATAVRKTAQAQGDFLEWLRHEKGYFICECLDNGELIPKIVDVNGLLHEYHGIDPERYEQEKLDLLESIRRGEQEAAECMTHRR